jgi:3-hydroxyacyl-[acyl-carrier-protein] dehydratase
MNWIDALPHRPPMRLVEEVISVTPGEGAIARRLTRIDDFFFQGHFPGQPVVPAIILVELLAQTGGLTVGAATEDEAHQTAQRTAQRTPQRTAQLRVAGFGPFKFPAAAGVGATLEATARLAGAFGGLFKIEGEVTADGVVVASGSVMLAR